jgi:hypothetical protein
MYKCSTGGHFWPEGGFRLFLCPRTAAAPVEVVPAILAKVACSGRAVKLPPETHEIISSGCLQYLTCHSTTRSRDGHYCCCCYSLIFVTMMVLMGRLSPETVGTCANTVAMTNSQPKLCNVVEPIRCITRDKQGAFDS